MNSWIKADKPQNEIPANAQSREGAKARVKASQLRPIKGNCSSTIKHHYTDIDSHRKKIAAVSRLARQ